jgi:hypothetical protein
MPAAPSLPPEAPWSAGLRGARANLAPGLVLQAVALAIVVAYYQYEPMRQLLGRLSEFRARTGLLYGCVATALFGGVLPCLYLKLHPATRHRYDGAQNACLIAFWGYKGIEVDLWYRFLARFVGEGHGPATVGIKMTLDQFVYCPIWAVPITVVIYQLCESHFDRKAVAADMRRPGWYRRRALPNLISNLGVWVPTVCIVYALPTSLQLPLFNLVLCFFTLLLAHLSQHTAKTD